MNNENQKNQNFIKKIILKDIKNKRVKTVRTRFPPEPNGYLHIGHAKSIFLNFFLAKQFNGTFNLRFDDTNPKKENAHYIKNIIKDVKWLQCNLENNIFYTSSYFEIIYKYAKELIKKGLAYVDQLTKEEIRIYRGTLTSPGINSPYRKQTVKENLLLFKKMKHGHFSEGDACLRAKIDMKSPFIVLRDPVLYRILFSEHHQTKNKWCIYPTYDFAHCISDSLEKITHSICTLEFQDNRKLYEWILKNISISHRAHQYEFSKLKLEYCVLSKRKLKHLVTNKIVSGWDDPRIPTISGLKKRGYTSSSIRTFCEKIGVTKQNHIIELSLLESCIRNDLNLNTSRYMAIINPIKVYISNLEDNYSEILTVPNHPNISSMGTHTTIFSNTIYIDRYDFCENRTQFKKKLKIGNEIRLRHAYTIIAKKIIKDNNDNITEIICTYDKNTLGKNPINKKVSGVIHWIAKKNAIPAKFNLYEKLFILKDPESKEDFLKYINKNSLIIKHGFIESSILNNISEKTYQFEREGYFCVEKNCDSKQKLTFNRIVKLKKNFKNLNK
ncbi:glutamate--tRNA ligase [Buchnera aphidicola (Schlechtendalia chinensis)]|uniref:Glutamine--tRNA ligase n=1 Tax=Buchnera aphidicola subsp. Schlechtendalia chinensis TaxID=118110 RepID=A0A172WDV5_BUCSC|nr:glutamine--tRNA ligase [Buchnera aphidicola]ANF17141.1 glutamate--tRNA ligase [Buchnera aphidicola (Schlechtendalia chinensis)]